MSSNISVQMSFICPQGCLLFVASAKSSLKSSSANEAMDEMRTNNRDESSDNEEEEPVRLH